MADLEAGGGGSGGLGLTRLPKLKDDRNTCTSQSSFTSRPAWKPCRQIPTFYKGHNSDVSDVIVQKRTAMGHFQFKPVYSIWSYKNHYLKFWKIKLRLTVSQETALKCTMYKCFEIISYIFHTCWLNLSRLTKIDHSSNHTLFCKKLIYP